jgi:predicted ATPase/class 3 adenylate cyclase
MAELPSGTVTFLLTDVEGSTALWEEAPEAMRAALARHDALFEAAVTEHRGVHIRPRGEGDSRFAVFSSAPNAVAAAVAIQRVFAAEPWPTSRPITVRIGIHTGEAELRDGDYYGSAVNRCARLRGIGHGGQVLLSEATAGLVRDGMPSGVRLLDLGRHRLKDLTEPERVSQVVAPDLASDFPSLASLDVRPHNLPTHPTALLGRKRELAEVRELFEDGARLVTLTGPGGTGKTRLGLQVAADLLDHYPDGVFFVPLAPISDPNLVISAVAQILGLRETGGRSLSETVTSSLRERQLLLLLDNFEQILPAARLVADLLAACPRLTVLVTSRAALRLRGEREYAVPPLALPDPKRETSVEVLRAYAAVALFTERAVDARASFGLIEENASTVAEICRRLDGLPLAIELAAARIKLVSPEALLHRLDRRLPLLTGGARDLPERQRTLRDTITWSYDLLDEAEQALFRRLGTFIGGCTIEAAEAVCDADGEIGIDVLDGIASLVDKSLLRQEDGPDGEPRLTTLETIREYALEWLEASGEAAELRRRHADYCVMLAERAAPELRGHGQAACLARLEADHDNLRAALRWAIEQGEVESGLRLAGALAWFWYVHGHWTAGLGWLEAALAASDGASASTRATALDGAGFLALVLGDRLRATTLLEHGLALFRDLADARGIARSLGRLGLVARNAGAYARATALLEESLGLYRGLGDTKGIATALWQLGSVARDRGDYARATPLFAESLALYQDLGDTRGVSIALTDLGLAAHARGESERAATCLEESLALSRGLGDRRHAAEVLEALARVVRAQGQPERAAQLLGAAEALREAVGAPRPAGQRAAYEHDLVGVQACLANQAFAAAWAIGRAMTLEQAVAYALDEQPSA